MTDKERYESLRHCKWVDEVIEDAPWVVDQTFLDQHQVKKKKKKVVSVAFENIYSSTIPCMNLRLTMLHTMISHTRRWKTTMCTRS